MTIVGKTKVDSTISACRMSSQTPCLLPLIHFGAVYRWPNADGEAVGPAKYANDCQDR